MAKADVNATRQFLENALARDWFHLVSINPKSESKATRGYVADGLDDAEFWIGEEEKRGHNIYYQLNAPAERQSKKSKSSELKWLYGAHVDIDLPAGFDGDRQDWIDDVVEELMSCPHLRGKPHIVMSGNGVQAVWSFAEPVRATTENKAAVEAINRRLAAQFQGDTQCCNPAHLLRVPGPMNNPGKAKLRKGYVPVRSELIHISRELYIFDDFADLPEPKKAKASAKNSPKYIDYTKKEYQELNPFTLANVLRKEPTLIEDTVETFNDPKADKKHDRTRAAWCFIHILIEFMCDELQCSAEDLCDDNDVKKNIMHLFFEAAEKDEDIDEVLSHYDEHQYRWGKLGYDIQSAIYEDMDQEKGWTERRAARSDRAGKVSDIAEKAIADISVHEARLLFLEYVHGASVLGDLPNCLGEGDKLSSRQLPTESNVEVLMRQAGILPRWDIMRDETRYLITDELTGKRTHSPRQLFEAALRKVHPTNRAYAEQMLIVDCFARFGITARQELPHLLDSLARRHYFHPLEDYCTAVEWDGVDRIAQVSECLNSTNPLKRRYMDIFFYQTVAVVVSLRRYLSKHEGEKIESIVILNGDQGLSKTKFWEALIPAGFKSEGSTLKLGQSKETDSLAECLSGAVCNLDEIEGSLMRSDHNTFKNFTSSRLDRYRTAWARVPVVKPRMTQFCGTANALALHDQSGDRRILVLDVTKIDLAAARRIDLQQIYAQAWQRVVVDREPWWLDADEEIIRNERNADHRSETVEASAIMDYLAHTTQQHQEEWLTMNQICKLLDIRFNPMYGPNVKQVLARNNIEFKIKVRRKRGPDLNRVFAFPVLPEAYQLLIGH